MILKEKEYKELLDVFIVTYLRQKDLMEHGAKDDCEMTEAVLQYISSILHVVFCTMLNAVYHIRLYIAAYHTDLSSILSLAARYNDKVESYVSFLLWSVAHFYFVKFLKCKKR